MVGAALTGAGRIGAFVARLSPAAFKAVDGLCGLLEKETSLALGLAAGTELEESPAGQFAGAQSIIALKAACEVRKALRRGRK